MPTDLGTMYFSIDLITKGLEDGINNSIKLVSGYVDTISNAGTGTFDKMKSSVKGFSNKSYKSFKKVEKSLSKFNMGILGIMFGAQQASKAFSGLTNAIKETFFYGIEMMFIQEIMDTLEPIIFQVSEIFWNLADAFSNMDPKWKTFISLAIILVPILGVILSTIAQFALLVTGLIGVVGGLGTALLIIGSPVIIAGIATLVGMLIKFIDSLNLGGALGDLPGMISSGFEKVKVIIGNITEKISDVFSNIWEKIKVKFGEAIVSIFNMLKELPVIGPILEFAEKVWNSLVTYFKSEKTSDDLKKAISDIFSAMGVPDGVLVFFSNLWDKIVLFIQDIKQIDSFKSAIGFVLKTMGVPPEVLTFMNDLWTEIETWIKSAEQIESFGDAIKWVVEGITIWKELGAYIANQMWSGIKEGLKEKGKNFVLSFVPMNAMESINDWLPKFQSGGVIPGRLGEAMPIIAHAGETVVPVGGRGGGGGSGNQIFIDAPINIAVYGEADAEEIGSQVENAVESLTWNLKKMRL